MIVRIEFADDESGRRAVAERVENHHVPPLGVTWVLTTWDAVGEQRAVKVNDYTSRKAAERAAETWVRGGGQ